MAGAVAVVEIRPWNSLSECLVSARELPFGLPLALTLSKSWMLPFEDFSPVRRLRSYKGQRNFTGSWWCATNGRHVGFESWLERDHLMFRDFDLAVSGISSQPFRLDFELAGSRRCHVPDYFLRLTDGDAVVLDVRPEARINARDRDVFEATRQACETVGWSYELVGDLSGARLANVRWLSGFRHERCLDPGVVAPLLEAVSSSGWPTIESVARSVGDPIAVLPSVYHLLWNHRLSADLGAAPLSPRTPITAGPP